MARLSEIVVIIKRWTNWENGTPEKEEKHGFLSEVSILWRKVASER
jgi:hypothetical protein